MKPSLFPLAADRGYMTPEDVGDAFKAGHRSEAVRLETLDWIGRKSAEDPSCCAFVAWKGGDSRKRLERVYWVVKYGATYRNTLGYWVRDRDFADKLTSRSEAFSCRNFRAANGKRGRVVRVSVYRRAKVKP